MVFSYNGSMRNPNALDGMVRWLAVTAVGVVLLLVLPRELLGTQPLRLGRLVLAPSALVGGAVLVGGWVYALVHLGLLARRWARDWVASLAASGIVVLPPFAVWAGLSGGPHLAMWLGFAAGVSFVAWALRTDWLARLVERSMSVTSLP